MNAVETKPSGSKRMPLLDREEVLNKARKYWAVRRFQDIVLSILGILVLWPLMLVTAIAVVLDSPGAGPIFAQTRVGRDGKTFTFYKFRSMCPNAEEKLDDLMDQNEMDGPVFKIKEDPRITRVGRFIRKTSIDELPQLWNILKGDMSIVGYRPVVLTETKLNEMRREYGVFATRPGITGLAQVSGRDNLSIEEKVLLDAEYVTKCSLGMDIRCILMTVKTVLTGEGVN